MKFLKVISLFVFISMFSCTWKRGIRGEELIKNLKEVESINGPVIYSYDLSSGELQAVYKYEYMKLPEYRISINKDSLQIGDTFIGWIIVSSSSYVRAKVYSPETFEMVGEEGEIRKIIKYKTDKLGVQEFRGEIWMDSIRIPFIYKFLVR
ncbi:MAG: hypothetical protein KF845_10410 [Cyclobacteriaceae bacterium]|nr:hypothetical protein [Cyclobacteriaceae bacterium]